MDSTTATHTEAPPNGVGFNVFAVAPDPSLYLGFGIEQSRCAACAAFPSLPCAVHREQVSA